jgi:Transcriptional regulator/sugar kinase
MASSMIRLGIDLGGSKIEIVALAPDGSERFRRRVPTPQDGYLQVLDAIADLVAPPMQQSEREAASASERRDRSRARLDCCAARTRSI